MAMKKKGYRSGGKVKRMSKGGAMGGKKPTTMMMGGGGAMTMAQLRNAAKQKGMKLSPMKKGGVVKKKK